ncbi:MAG TPA: proton-conducting transporter membrane subunit, partial [Thermoleophilaceae bacterium]|nr:proton-conducting transporter membrane subunit [Thermoleophilaceae bacterium]
VALPLASAALLGAAGKHTPRRLADAVAILVAAAVGVACVALAWSTRTTPGVYWFGGWQLRAGMPLGIAFVIDLPGASFAAVAALLATLALVYSLRFFDSIGSLFHSLILVFLAGVCGFCLTGDLFNLFVFFELLSTAAYALVGYKIDQRAPLEGSLNFAITNSLGAIMVLFGIALLYGRTGALNMAQIGHSLAQQHTDGLVVVAFTLLVAGFFVKAAVVPFHFWLPDAYSVAPTPVCAVLSAVMSELGLYAVVRIWASCFHGAFGGHEDALRAILVVAGTITALVPAVLCFTQTHLKRMLAYATVSYIGLFLIGAGLLTHDALGGTAIYLVGDGFVKAALFTFVGIVQNRRASVDEYRLQGRGRDMPLTGALFALGGLALASLPPFGTFLGKSLVEDAALKAGYGWVIVVFVLASAITGGAVLRAAGRVFLGLGPAGESEPAFEVDEETKTETGDEEGRGRTPFVMILPALALLAGGLAVGLIPGLPQAALRGAAALQDQGAYIAAVLKGSAGTVPHLPAPPPPTGADYVYGALSCVGALALAAVALFREQLPALLPRPVTQRVGAAVWAVRRLNSGRVGDYVAWIATGVTVFGAAFALTLL